MRLVDCGGVFALPVPASLLPVPCHGERLELLSVDGRAVAHVTALPRVAPGLSLTVAEGEAEAAARLFALESGAPPDVPVVEDPARVGRCAEARFGVWAAGMPLYVGVVAVVWPDRVILCSVTADPHHTAFEEALRSFRDVVPSSKSALLSRLVSA